MSTELQITAEKVLANQNLGKEEALHLFNQVRDALETGTLRIAEKVDGKWMVNGWVKSVILLGFKFGKIVEVQSWDGYFFDKDTIPLHKFTLENQIRLVPGGSAIRCGCHVAPGTVIMPPAYINIGAYVDKGCMIDSHALVGSCAQIGKNVHLSAASQIGGVLEPVGAMPVIIEDNVFIGGNCGIYEGTIVEENAVIGSGVILNAATPVFDNTTGEFIQKTAEQPLTIPKNAVVIAGSRPIKNGAGQQQNIHIYCPVIIKYKDSKTSKSTTLEELLR
jgi:2,3,4,5-tetrahydropyridine-2-carboxylate N-succinyltransferase